MSFLGYSVDRAAQSNTAELPDITTVSRGSTVNSRTCAAMEAIKLKLVFCSDFQAISYILEILFHQCLFF